MEVLHELSESECRALLADHDVGRVAVVAPNGPHIIEVNFALVDESIVIRTSPHSLLGTYGRGAELAFHVDHVDDATHTGWSVLVRGRADVVRDVRLIQHIRQRWDPTPWPEGARDMYLQLQISELSGRHLGSAVGGRQV